MKKSKRSFWQLIAVEHPYETIVALLFILALLLIVLWTVIIAKQTQLETVALREIGVTVQEDIGLLDQLQNIREPQATARVFSDFETMPEFEYPNGWHIVVRDEINKEAGVFTVNLFMRPDPIRFCTECGFLTFPVTMVSRNTSGLVVSAGSGYIEASASGLREAESKGDVSNLVLEIKDLENGALLKASYDRESEVFGESTEAKWIFVNDGKTIDIIFQDFTPDDDADNAAWELFKATVDFSHL